MKADHTQFYAHLGRNIRHAREASGLTQVSVADYLDLSRPSMSNIEGGRQISSAHTLVMLTELFQRDLTKSVASGGNSDWLLEQLQARTAEVARLRSLIAAARRALDAGGAE